MEESTKKTPVALKQGIGLMTVSVQVGDQEWAVNNYYQVGVEGAFKACFRSCEEALDRLDQRTQEKK